MIKLSYEEKFQKIVQQISLKGIPDEQIQFIEAKAHEFKFSFQEVKKLVDVSKDLITWDEANLNQIWPNKEDFTGKDKALKQKILNNVFENWQNLRSSKKSYDSFNKEKSQKFRNLDIEEVKREDKILGRCPVASEKTRCCNLLTLDAVINCGLDCSYCSIQSFYSDGKIFFDKDFKKKLEAIELDPNKDYHIGTGQSSDSLMWGNKHDILKNLFDFARKNQNALLELKTKSKNIKYLIENEVPKNIFATWSLSPQRMIENEESFTATMMERITAARKVADTGIKVGFHLHPIIYYEGFEKDYHDMIQLLQETFKPSEVILISMGTLTFIKPVLKKIRERGFKSKILQMDMVNAEGKLSYPLSVKEEIFKTVFSSFKESWQKDIFHFLCMEDKTLWKKVYGHEYDTNEIFEKDMISSYKSKLGY